MDEQLNNTLLKGPDVIEHAYVLSLNTTTKEPRSISSNSELLSTTEQSSVNWKLQTDRPFVAREISSDRVPTKLSEIISIFKAELVAKEADIGGTIRVDQPFYRDWEIDYGTKTLYITCTYNSDYVNSDLYIDCKKRDFGYLMEGSGDLEEDEIFLVPRFGNMFKTKNNAKIH